MVKLKLGEDWLAVVGLGIMGSLSAMSPAPPPAKATGLSGWPRRTAFSAS